MENILNIVMPIVIGGGFVLYLIYDIFNTKSREKKRKRSSILYNASVTDNGVPADEVFKTVNYTHLDLLRKS